MLRELSTMKMMCNATATLTCCSSTAVGCMFDWPALVSNSSSSSSPSSISSSNLLILPDLLPGSDTIAFGENGPLPTTFRKRILASYTPPCCNSITTHLEEGDKTPSADCSSSTMRPSLESNLCHTSVPVIRMKTSQCVMPGEDNGMTHDTRAQSLPSGWSVGSGAAGGSRITSGADETEHGPQPAEFEKAIDTRYSMLFESPVIVVCFMDGSSGFTEDSAVAFRSNRAAVWSHKDL
mmetsp:Transcript_38581/g.111471  ORF Transcript_38581/g.111471 Transcript_38581/m.111471 type:complete len:237 (-) Transcript_38581:1096-1806(-)